MLHLAFRLHGPLASWGNVALGTHRPSLAAPTRSAVLGLIAGALGYRRGEDQRHEALDAALGVAVRIDASGQPHRDYHTAQAAGRNRHFTPRTRTDELTDRDNLHTVLSVREYVTDAAYTVLVWKRDSAPADAPTLEDVQAAMERPRFVPFLGRRSCPPSLPFSPHLVDADSLREAFERAAFPDPDAHVLNRLRTRARESTRFEFDDHPAHGFAVDPSRHPQRDVLASSSRRIFHVRHVNTLNAAPEETP